MIPQKIGRYEIKRELGRGGMATVFQAFDPRFKRDVAIKVLPREFLHDPQFRARFEREAQTIAALEYPAIVPVYDFGEDAESGQLYIVMRLMTGGSLAERLAQGPLPLWEAARILSHLTPALDKAHTKGIIHRDLKPGNILFDTDRNPYISDFGIVKLAEATASFTGSGVIGTPAFMSPEQVRGDKSIDGRSDIYTLGAILFTLLTGKQPYNADTPMGVAVKHITEPTPHILDVCPDLPPGIDAVIQKAMAKEPAARFSTAQELAEALADVAKGGNILSSPTLKAIGLSETLPARPASIPQKRPWWLYGLIGLILLSAGAALWLGRKTQAPVSEALLVTASHTPAPSHTVSPSPTEPTQTPTPSVTQTITSTPTPRPTRTATPLPAWVQDFAQPVLDSIAGQEPTFQDDFSDNSGGWRLEDWVVRLGYRLRFDNGELTVSSGTSDHSVQIWRDMWAPNLAIELDYRFLPSASGNDRWDLYYRTMGGGERSEGHHYRFYYNGNVEANLGGASGQESRTQLPGAALSGSATNHVLLIAKGHEFALYLNDRPVFYKMGEPIFLNGGFLFTMEDQQVAIDNFKLWELSGE